MHTQYEGHMFSFSCIVTPIFEPWKIITLFIEKQTNPKIELDYKSLYIRNESMITFFKLSTL